MPQSLFFYFQLVERFLTENIRIQGSGPEVLQSQLYICKLCTAKLLNIIVYLLGFHVHVIKDSLSLFYYLKSVNLLPILFDVTSSQFSLIVQILTYIQSCVQLSIDSLKYGGQPQPVVQLTQSLEYRCNYWPYPNCQKHTCLPVIVISSNCCHC